MPYLTRDGIQLFYEEAGQGGPPLLFVHGFAGDHSQFAPQLAHFARDHRVVAVDRRGHGRSDKPEQEYTIALFADDIAWTCREMGLYRPVAVVHSQGGLGLEIAARHPDLLAGLVILDAPLFPPEPLLDQFRQAAVGLRSPAYRDVLHQVASGLFAPTDEPARRNRLLAEIVDVPQHVLASSWEAFLAHDANAAAMACTIPLLCVAGVFPADLARLRRLCPQLVEARIAGCGHWLQLERPSEVNAFIARFLAKLPALVASPATA